MSRYSARVAGVAVLALLAACSDTGIVEPGPFQAADLLISGNTMGKIVICHRTNSITNPYVRIEVANSAADGISGKGEGQGDHFANPSHQGPIFDPAVHTHSSDDWGDIIPPMDGIHTGANWTDAGQAILANGCKLGSGPEPGTIQVGIELFPALNGVDFSFTGAVNTTLVSQVPTTPLFEQSVPAGTHFVTGPAFVPSAGYVLIDIICTETISPPPSSGDPGTATATYSVEPGETVQCIFQYALIG